MKLIDIYNDIFYYGDIAEAIENEDFELLGNELANFHYNKMPREANRSDKALAPGATISFITFLNKEAGIETPEEWVNGYIGTANRGKYKGLGINRQGLFNRYFEDFQDVEFEYAGK